MQHDKMTMLVRLQILDSELFEVLSEQRGLPEEISTLQEQAAEFTSILQLRKKKFDEGEAKKNLLQSQISDAQIKIKKYKEAQTAARNNKEYDALSKQIEFEELEIKKAENQIKAIEEQENRQKELEIKGAEFLNESRYDEVTDDMMPTEHLKTRLKEIESEAAKKSKELKTIVAETQADIDALTIKISEQRKEVAKIEKGTLAKYDVLRSSNIQDAVVKFVRNACGGCNSRVPASKHAIIHQGGYYACEACGRIVVHEKYFEVPVDAK